MTYIPSLGRFIQEDPIEFEGGDPNLYRYVGNNPANRVDPSGLWTWQLGPAGQVFAISEPNDTLNALIGQGYDKEKLLEIAQQNRIGAGDQLAAGQRLDLTPLLPKEVQEVLRRQQALSWQDQALQGHLRSAGAPPIPKGRTLGTSGIDLMQTTTVDETMDKIVKKPLHGFPFGWGNCYGFVGLFRGVKPREGHPPQNLFLGPLKGEGFWSADPDRAPAEAGFYPSDRPYPKEIGGPWGAIVPEGGLGRLLTGGMERTRQPTFGSVALFRRDDDMGFRHAAIVLGRSKEGTVYVIQKLNQAAPYAISPVNHPLLQDFGSPIYYSR